jgi:DNA modification methylase
MKRIGKGSIDAIITDPPYMISSEIRISRGRNRMKFKGKDIVQNFGSWDHFKDIKAFIKFTKNWLDECVRVLREGGIFITYFDKDKINFVSNYLKTRYGFKLKGYFAHLKSNPVPQARKVKWMSGWEIAGIWQKPGGKLTFNYQIGQQKDWEIVLIVTSMSKKEPRYHPTQKPERIIELFVRYWTNRRDIILDPFSGSGTVPVVAKRLGRRFIGIENGKQWVRIARKRLKGLGNNNY